MTHGFRDSLPNRFRQARPGWTRISLNFQGFFYCFRLPTHYFSRLDRKASSKNVNSEYCKQALAKVGNPNVLINLISRRVRQLNSAGGIGSRPLLNEVAGLGAADIALKELIEEKMGWEDPADLQLEQPAPKKRKRG
jgi:DNA-directed RNA polymerase subunit omega